MYEKRTKGDTKIVFFFKFYLIYKIILLENITLLKKIKKIS